MYVYVCVCIGICICVCICVCDMYMCMYVCVVRVCRFWEVFPLKKWCKDMLGMFPINIDKAIYNDGVS